MSENEVFARMCPHCATTEARRLGVCCVCGRIVCAECGNVQIAKGERQVTHKECLKKSDSCFTMIKFVR